MARRNGTNGHVKSDIKKVLELPTIEELKRAYDEGLEQTLLSGLKVVMRPVRPDTLLVSGKVPDILTPLIMKMMFARQQEDDTVFPDEVKDPITHYLTQERAKAQEAMEFIKSVDVVCEAALVDPSIVPYLSLNDRMWIFKIAFLPVEILSRFRHQPPRNVEAGDDSAGEPLPSESIATVDSGTK